MDNKLGITAFQLKILAIICMVIDHAGKIFFPDLILMIFIGRVTFPIFAFFIAEGYIHTKNLEKYFIRLFILAVFSQIPYYYMTNSTHTFENPNIVFTLILGLLSIFIYDKIDNTLVNTGLILSICFLAEQFALDYGAYGILTIFVFYLFRERWGFLSLTLLIINVTFILNYLFTYSLFKPIMLIQSLSLLALPFLYSYNGKQGIKAKNIFYIFYPLHITILILIRGFLI